MGAAGTADAGSGDDAGDDAANDGAGNDDAAKAADDGPPETYDLKMPDDIELDAELVAEATPLFKDAGLSNDQANKLVPLAIKVQERLLKTQADNFEALSADWAKSAMADAEIGGRNWPQTEVLVAKALDTFGAPAGSEFRKLLDQTRLGNHPEMIRMFRTIGEKLGEDDFVRSDKGTQTKPAREEVMYPNDVPKKQE